MGAEDYLNADDHYCNVYFVLEVFKKSFARRVRSFVSCCNHRYSLAMRDVIKVSSKKFKLVRYLMRKLSYHIPAARLRRKTSLRSNLQNVSRWSSTLEFLKR